MGDKNKNLCEEFNIFLTSPKMTPPLAVTESVLLKVHEDLNPSIQNVFLKMLGIHTFISLFSLSICSQFGIRSLPIYDAMKAFMAVVGHNYCMVFCGVLYLGLSAFALSLLLRPEDIKVIRHHRVLKLTLLAGVSLGVFLCLGAEILLLPAFLWTAGSLVGGLTSLELGWALRSFFRKRLIYGN